MNQDEATKACKKCNGTGWWQYDKNHAQVCPGCCLHGDGWWVLTEHHSNPGRECCSRGCGYLNPLSDNEDSTNSDYYFDFSKYM